MESNKYHIGRRRAVALLLDSILIYVPLLAVTSNAMNFQNYTLLAIASIIYPVFKMSYFVLWHYHSGQTLAKSVLNIKVVDVTESRSITLKQAVMRELVWILIEGTVLLQYILNVFEVLDESGLIVTIAGFASTVGYLWLLLEVVTVLTNKERRSINDFIAGTVVIRTE